jgi:hypothetical protein
VPDKLLRKLSKKHFVASWLATRITPKVTPSTT